MSRLISFTACLALAAAAISSSSLESHVDVLTINSFNPIKEAYWTGYPHHRRTPFAVSPDGTRAFIAYLSSSGTGVYVQRVDPDTFEAVGSPASVSAGLEAAGLVAHNDGFALLTNEVVSGEGDVALPVLYRYTDGTQTFRTLLGGSGIDSDNDLASPDVNGDLVYSETAGIYGAYIVVTSVSGSASGHYGDAIRYITKDGTLETISGASSSWGCSHNTGIAFEEADAAPFASLCAEDQGAIWLNTKSQGMTNDNVKVSNEHVINGASNEPMGGMSGSYSSIARFQNADSYLFTWVSRGAIDLTANTWMGDGYTTAENRTNNRNVAMAFFSDKNTLVGDEATSVVGTEDGDSQVNWITSGSEDCSNAHVATFDKNTALVTYETISNPICDFDAMGCRGTFSGTHFQLVSTSTGAAVKSGDAITSDDVYVAGDMVTMSDGRICWPYVSMTWDLSGAVTGSAVTKMSFACISNGGTSGSSTTAASSTATKKTTSAAAATSVASTTKVAVASSSVEAVEESAAATSSVISGAPRPSIVTLSSADVTNVLTEASSAAASSAAAVEPTVVVSSAAAAETTVIASSAAADTSVIAVPSSIITSVVTPSEPSSTPSTPADSDDEDDCDNEPAFTQTETPKTPTRTRTRTRGTRTRTRGSAATGTCYAHTVTETVYVTAGPMGTPAGTPAAYAWGWH